MENNPYITLRFKLIFNFTQLLSFKFSEELVTHFGNGLHKKSISDTENKQHE
jgi:hypothetical protein